MAETFVLVHGAWHGGWTWRPVAERLRELGHRVLTPTLPGLSDGEDPAGHTLADACAHVAQLIAGEELKDVTLVAHSWGGYVATGAAATVGDRLRKLVYWGAFVPAEGRSLLDEVPPEYSDAFHQAAEASGNNTVAMPFALFQQAFMQDAPEAVQRMIHGLLVPQPMQYFSGTVAPLDTRAVPASYVLSLDDLALPPGEYQWSRFAERLGVEPLNAPGSHEALFTQPEGLVKAILQA